MMTESRSNGSLSALFVDFDNLCAGLRRSDPRAAQRFASAPERWVQALAQGQDRPGGPGRRFLVRACYLNPQLHGQYRASFAAAGFRVTDCPSLTAAAKNAADIQIALDVCDALTHVTRFEEFVIASADADFTPLVHRIRAHDRRVTVVAAGPLAAAYRAVCDSVVPTEQLVQLVGAPPVPKQRSAPGSATTGARPAGAVAAVRQAVAASPGPVTGGSAAQAAMKADATIADGWAGAGTFAAFVARHLPELVFIRTPGPGRLYDPRRSRDCSDIEEDL